MTNIDFFNDYNNKLSYNEKLLKKFSIKILQAENQHSAQISIIFSTRNKLNKLKKSFFNLNHDTDVIAFNLENKDEPIEGEIYISIDDVLSNAREYNQKFNIELKRIIIHGLLHLAGYDDKNKNEKKIMSALEDKYLLISTNNLINLEG